MTQIDDVEVAVGGLAAGDDPEDGNEGARRPEHGGQTSSLPKKEEDNRKTKQKKEVKTKATEMQI